MIKYYDKIIIKNIFVHFNLKHFCNNFFNITSILFLCSFFKCIYKKIQKMHFSLSYIVN